MSTLLIAIFAFFAGIAAATAWPNAFTWTRRASSVPVFEGGAILDPAHPDLPDSVDATENAKIARIPHADLRDLVRTLQSWKPRRHKAEDSFQRSFQAHLADKGYSEATFERHPRIFWTAEDRAPDSRDALAKPDFRVKRVLVEIKRNIDASAESDRALGQMARYCIAFRRQGPALLVVCNDYDANLRTFVERTVRGWKAQGIPVMAYFAREATVDPDDYAFAPDAFRN